LEGWAKFTSAAYTHHGPSVAGNHLFLYTNPIRDTWMAGIVKAIEAARLLPAPQPWPSPPVPTLPSAAYACLGVPAVARAGRRRRWR